MKSTKSKIFRNSQIAIAASALFAGSIATAQNSSSSTTSSATSANQQSSSNQNQSNRKEVRITRGSNFMGSDVMSTDDRKVGDISDFYFDPNNAPHLKYVVITTGGFLGFGGNARAVPPEALTSQGDTVKLNRSYNDFWSLPVLPDNQKRYLRNPENARQVAQAFNRAGQGSSSSSTSNNQSTQNQNQNQRNQSGQGTLVSFSDLRNSDVSDSEGQDLGRFVDVWISLNLNRAPYAEISAMRPSPYNVLPRTRYAVPMTELQADSDEDGRYQIKMTEAKLRDSEQISESKGIQMVESGTVGRSILRVDVPDVDGNSRNNRASSASE